MKKISLRRFISGTAALTVTTALLTAISSPGAPGHGTDILHLSVVKSMTNEGVESTAGGRVVASQNEQGRADNQRLDIRVHGLETNTTYQLVTLFGDDTNLTGVTTFDTDAKGRAVLLYRSLGNGHAQGHGKNPLPDALNPVSDIRELDVFNSSTQAVLSADLTMPDKLQYLIKRDLSTNGVDAALRIKATTRKTQFRLLATGLAPGDDYWLVLNGDISQTNSADANGRLMITQLLQGPANVLDLRTLELWDTASNVVLSTQLP